MKKIIEQTTVKDLVAIVLLGAFLFGLIRYVDYRFDQIITDIDNTNKRVEASEAVFEQKIKDLSDLFLATLTEEQKKSNKLRSQLRDINETVGTLEKLSITDKELLKKYSKVYFLNEHYVPLSLGNIPAEYVNKGANNFQMHNDVLPYLEEMFENAKQDGMTLLAQSAYRSFAAQSTLKANYVMTYGVGTANTFSADQGYSEHQLGTTLDFTTEKLNGSLEGFDKTPEYTWLLANAHKYGFVISYPAGNTYYKFEPWHWRYVGVELATKLHEDNMFFYDMDQRVIDSYLARIFD